MSDTFFHRFTDNELAGLERLKKYASEWCNKHQCTVGVTEMALGAALLTAGWQNGAIQMGVDFVAHTLNSGWAAELTGGGSAGIAGLAAYVLGNVGVAAAGTAFCVPALALAGGAALVFGLAGYGTAKLVEDFLHQAPNIEQLVTATGMVALGAWLIVDGARRVPLIRESIATARDAGLYLARVAQDFVIDNVNAFATVVREEVAPFLHKLANSGSGAALAGAASLGAVGAVVAPSLLTVAGSSTLGTAALSLGLVSAPVWPIVAGVGVGLAAGYGLWTLFKRDEKANTNL